MLPAAAIPGSGRTSGVALRRRRGGEEGAATAGGGGRRPSRPTRGTTRGMLTCTLLENLDVQIYVPINFLNLTHRINNSIIASIVTSKKERERKMIDRFNNQHLFAGKFSTNACMPTISKQISNKFQYVIQ